MRYRLTALTPLLVGDGTRLAPIDYMVWRDQVNVLDQRRIIRLLARGPRLEGYLTQLRRAQKLDFASWGGFAQNYAGRRIPLEHPSLAAAWDQTAAEHLFIPLFAASAAGPYVPGSALKGALRTAVLAGGYTPAMVASLLEVMGGERKPRQLGPAAEAIALRGTAALKGLAIGDSKPFDASALRVYLLRTAKLPGGWKPTPVFAEMARPRGTFAGDLRAPNFDALRRGANAGSRAALDAHMRFAQAMNLPRLVASTADLRAELEQAEGEPTACVFQLGYGGGLFSKTILPEAAEERRSVLQQVTAFEAAIRTGAEFPKTRRIVLEDGEPSTLPGWVRLEAAAC